MREYGEEPEPFARAHAYLLRQGGFGLDAAAALMRQQRPLAHYSTHIIRCPRAPGHADVECAGKSRARPASCCTSCLQSAIAIAIASASASDSLTAHCGPPYYQLVAVAALMLGHIEAMASSISTAPPLPFLLLLPFLVTQDPRLSGRRHGGHRCLCPPLCLACRRHGGHPWAAHVV